MQARQLTYPVIFAAGRDAGNRLMRRAGRTKWAKADYRAACAEFRRLEKLMLAEQKGAAR
jgi:hypothetical protein